MVARVFADDLQGAGWDRVRAIRQSVFGINGRGVALDADRVPEVFRRLLPYASLLTTGEEGALLDFWDALGPDERDVFLSAVRSRRRCGTSASMEKRVCMRRRSRRQGSPIISISPATVSTRS